MVGIVVGVVGALTGVAGVVVAWYGGRKAERATANQQRLATYSAASVWLRDLRVWASEAIDVIAEASYTCGHGERTKEDCEQQLRDCRYQISALIDRGRFFLPNQHVDELGQEKPSAFRGWRHAALDPLVAAERILSGEVGSGRFATREIALVTMQREFVSVVQRILDPSSHNKEIAQMIKEAHQQRATDRTMGGLLPEEKVTPTGADRLIYGVPKRSQ